MKRALEEKKAKTTEVKNSEKLAMQSVQKKTTTLEVYSKVLKPDYFLLENLVPAGSFLFSSDITLLVSELYVFLFFKYYKSD